MKATPQPPLRIGCSGWQYKGWRGDFYPATLPLSRWFAHYATHFDTVEINNSFYRLPDEDTFAAWRDKAPPGFIYAVKASRFLTHMKKLKDPEEPVGRFLSHAGHLGRTLGPLLYQLPPNFPANRPRLETFLKALPPERDHAVEFRDPSWNTDGIFACLEEHRVALCLHDMRGSGIGKRRVGPFVYVRFHGTERYGGRYPDAEIEEWAAWLAGQSRHGVPVYAYFNNDIGGHAPRDATRLREAALGLSRGD